MLELKDKEVETSRHENHELTDMMSKLQVEVRHLKEQNGEWGRGRARGGVWGAVDYTLQVVLRRFS